MKICIFTDVFYPYLLGGGENRYFEIAKQLISHGDEVGVITTSLMGQSRYEELENGRIKIFRFGFPPHPMTHRSLASMMGYVTSSVLKMRIFDEYDLFDLNTYASAFIGKFVAFFKKKPCVITLHDVFTPSWIMDHKSYSATLAMLAENVLARVHKRGYFVAVSKMTKSKMVETLKINQERIFVVPNGIDFGYIDAIASKTKKNDGPLKKMIYIGRLVRYKNPDHAIYVLKALRDRGLKVTLDLVGAGIERKKLEKLATDLGVSRWTRYHGFVKKRKRVIELIRQANVLINPSSFEGFGIVLLEGMAARTPVVAYNLEAYSEFAVNGYNALLVNPKNLQDLVNAVYLTLADQELSSKLIQNGYDTAKKFDWPNIRGKLMEVYRMALTE